MKTLKFFGLLASLLLVSEFTFAKAYPFSFKSKDGLAELSGEIDTPDTGTRPFPLVVMVPGTGLFDRDVLFGHSGTDRDFIFKDLSQALNAAGVATLRFDLRGVQCNSRVNPPRTDCVDNDIRKSVTPETIRADILDMYHYGVYFPDIDASKVSIFAHSEGTIHVSRLIGQKQIAPHSLIFMGFVAESPLSILHWQFVDRQVDMVFKAAKINSDILTNDEIDAFCAANNTDAASCAPLKSPIGYWTRDSLTAQIEKNYQEIKRDALTTPEAQAWPRQAKPGDRVQASYRWWKMWFTDNRNDVDDIAGFKGRVFMHNGDIDSQTPGLREFQFMQNSITSFSINPVLNLHTGKGHGLGADPLFGPIDPSLRDQMVDEFSSDLKSTQAPSKGSL